MNTHRNPRELAIDLCSRSPCRVKMACVLSDGYGIFNWGWNHPGPKGIGEHAEAMAIRRANRKRLKDSKATIAGYRGRTLGPVKSKPCEACQALLEVHGVERVEWMEQNGVWRMTCKI